MFNIVFQGQLLLSVDKDADTVSMALFSALYNVGIALGAMIGAAAFDHSPTTVPLVSAQLTFLAFIIAVVFMIPVMKALSNPPGGSA